ncbi:MAG: pyrroline-5-carboxylate reductase [Cyanobacteria bacterium HKST-UBA04]|nr:pyrroline-5-carboxylate reductase [Cyanobacteria bacterium HKST-UBA04]MCA9842511.1 pyrroline-5-carboxylate reductase [Cyanobacteria bacterium HKST-UBA03]
MCAHKVQAPRWDQQSLGVIGAGVMGCALINGIRQAGLLDDTQLWTAVKSSRSQERVAEATGIRTTTNVGDYIADTTLLLLCVKPNTVETVIGQLKAGGLKPDTVIISIAAGVSIKKIQDALGSDYNNPVLRVMTNTPSLIGQGMSVVSPSAEATDTHVAMAKAIFNAVGLCISLDEQHLDAVTGLSGAGPAYFYLMMEAMADGGVNVGLPRDVALTLVAQTALGAAMMVKQSSRHPAALRDDVTTPAGCTIAGLLTMEDGKIRSVLARAVEEATQIASKLG